MNKFHPSFLTQISRVVPKSHFGSDRSSSAKNNRTPASGRLDSTGWMPGRVLKIEHRVLRSMQRDAATGSGELHRLHPLHHIHSPPPS
ncbi:hypothetical protein NPIL_432291 [Nephila pilipes]|uniref:Uncharacterized protein n=1 Tax=Nephila pilipes TaxID=299642 RepID=A0A8X6QL86_NEPPI|nr:hypothetical protein NPIL_432291 [Nephila pilipes]